MSATLIPSCVDEYIAGAGIASDVDGPLFRTTGRSTDMPHRVASLDEYGKVGI